MLTVFSWYSGIK